MVGNVVKFFARSRFVTLSLFAVLLLTSSGAFAQDAPASSSLYVIHGGHLYKQSTYGPDTRVVVGAENWTGVTSMTTDTIAGHPLFVIRNGTLLSVNPNTGVSSSVPAPAGTPGIFPGSTRMTMVLGLAAGNNPGDLVFTAVDHMWRVNPVTGTLADLGAGWAPTTSLGTDGWRLHAIAYTQYYEIDTFNPGNWRSVAGFGWGGPTLMATNTTQSNGSQYVVQSNYLLGMASFWTFDPQYVKVTGAQWSDATSIAVINGPAYDFVYLVKGGQLWKVVVRNIIRHTSTSVTAVTQAVYPGQVEMVGQL